MSTDVNIPVCPPKEILDFLRQHYVYDPNNGIVYRYIAHCMEYKPVGSYDTKGYLRLTVKNKKIKIAHIAWFLHYGKWPMQQIDHIDRARDNNRINNLREIDQDGNLDNGPMATKLAKGICLQSNGRYSSYKWVRGEGNVYRGTFDTVEQASKARGN